MTECAEQKPRKRVSKIGHCYGQALPTSTPISHGFQHQTAASRQPGNIPTFNKKPEIRIRSTEPLASGVAQYLSRPVQTTRHVQMLFVVGPQVELQFKPPCEMHVQPKTALRSNSAAIFSGLSYVLIVSAGVRLVLFSVCPAGSSPTQIRDFACACPVLVC